MRGQLQFAAAVVEEQPVETDSAVSAENFEAMCDDLEPGGPDAYAHFRLMSSMTHHRRFSVTSIWPTTPTTPKPSWLRVTRLA
jgi:hypothetical protein